MPLAQARIALNKLAHDAGGQLEVSKAGDILYSFPANFESVYNKTGLRLALQNTFSGAKNTIFYILRISFGVLLVASFITIAVVFAIALVFIIMGIGAAEGADGDLDGMDLDFDFFDLSELGVFFSWNIFTGQETLDDSQSVRYLGMEVEQPNRGFFYNCFSFLFGDGDPNKKILDKQWKYLAELIRLCNGVVTTEQLAPYLQDTRTDDKGIFPALVRFEGIPEVTDKGNIVYTFPSLQVTAIDPKLVDLPVSLQEEQWKFSQLPMERLQWVFFFAGANLCGAYALSRHLHWFQPLVPYATLINWIMIYAIFFMGFPILRQLANNFRNTLIDSRNQLRFRQAKALAEPSNQQKIIESQKYAQKKIVLSRQQMEYSTGKDLLDQEIEQMNYPDNRTSGS